MKILNQYNLAKLQFEQRLKNRERIFNSYKTIVLLKILRSAQTITTQLIAKMHPSIFSRIKIIKRLECRMKLCNALYKHYVICRQIKKYKTPMKSKQNNLL